MNTNKKCICFTLDFEEGDTLYKMYQYDWGIGYEYIENIKYCPVCGKKLPNE